MPTRASSVYAFSVKTMNILPFTQPHFAVEISLPHTTVILSAPCKLDYERLTLTMDTMKKAADENAKEYYGMRLAAMAAETAEKYGTGGKIPLMPDMAEAFIGEYLRQIDEYREKNMDYLRIPGTDDFSVGVPDKLPVMTSAENAVYTFSGIDFIRQAELSIIEYWMILADSIKAQILRTKDGRETLNGYWHDMHHVNTM